jgi:hypothetical protein
MLFDRSRLTICSAADRPSRVHAKDALQGLVGVPTFASDSFARVAQWLRTRKGPKVWFLGGHVIKANVQWYLQELLKHGFIDHLAMNGAALVHDWELAKLGHTSEHVPTAIFDGSFGLWSEIGQINDVIHQEWLVGQRNGIGWGIGHAERNGVIGCAYDLSMNTGHRIATTVHVGIGQDVFFEHPNCDGAAWGEQGYIDFLKFAHTVERLEGGTFLCFGSAVCAPEIFLKALAMARNANGKPHDIAVAVFDCVPLPTDPEVLYFHRGAKNLLSRVASQSQFVLGKHEETIPNLWKSLCAEIA